MRFLISLDPAETTAIGQAVAAVIQPQLDQIKRRIELLMLDVSALVAAVAKETEVEKSAVALITKIAAQMKDLAAQLATAIAANDPAAIAAAQKAIDDAATTLAANNAELASAVMANTPAAPVLPPAA